MKEKPKLLIVEDNRELDEILVEAFTERAYEVEYTLSGEEGLNRILEGGGRTYDCVILDLMLPGMDGLEVLDRVREANNDTPILILSARDSVDDRVAGLERGADDYLVKPYEFRELAARVEALIRRTAEHRRPLLECGPLVMDPIARECRVGDKPVVLRRREFDIFQLLLRYENEVFSRDRIIAHVWQKEYDGTSNVVDVHVKYLRDKLREFGLDTCVVTVRGVGYKVIQPTYPAE